MEKSNPQDTAPKLVRSLATLPRELVHNVLNDLPLYKVLQILSHQNQYLVECVMTHMYYRRVFVSTWLISNVVGYFNILVEIRAFQNVSVLSSYRERYLKTAAASMKGIHPEKLKSWMIASVEKALDLPLIDLELLQQYSKSAYPQGFGNTTVQKFRERWEWIKAVKLQINAIKARQHEIAAEIISTFPGKILLKKLLDPSQDGLRKNTQHIADNFRSRAKKIRRDDKLDHGAKNKCSTEFDYLDLIPYDRYLWLYLDMVSKHPLPDIEPESVEVKLNGLSLDEKRIQFENKTESESAEHFNEKVGGKSEGWKAHEMPHSDTNAAQGSYYPAEILEALKIVQNGLMFVYTGSPLLVVPRIDWNPKGSTGEKKKPKFLTTKKEHSPDIAAALHRCPVRKTKPHDKREFQWLKAFLKVVTWMEETEHQAVKSGQ